MPGSCQVPLWAHPGRNALCRGWHSPASEDEVHHRSHPIPAWVWASSASVPWGGGRKMPLSPSMGNMPGEWAELLASQPCWVRAGPHHETWCSSLMRISFISALYQHSTALALGNEEPGEQAVLWYSPSPCLSLLATCMSSEGNTTPSQAGNQGTEVLLWLGPAPS